VLTEIAVLALLDTNLKLIAIVDDKMAGQRFLGQTIEPHKALRETAFDRLVITAGESREKVAEFLTGLGVAKEKICALQ
jgi:hypothetical protein